MPNTIKFSDNPNEDTAFVTMEDDTRTRAVVTTAVEGEVKFSDNPNSTKVKVTVDGTPRQAVAVYNLNGGDSHNKGYYADQEALEEAVPEGEAGDYAVVGDTDTIWIWDEDTSAWVDSDQKGQVTSVNSQTGDVTITAASISALPTSGGTLTGDIAFSKTGYNDKVVGNHNGSLRIGTSTTPSYDDLFISIGNGGARSISFGNGNGGQLGSSAAKFERTYTQKLNNGADVAIPTVAGAIALQESTMPTADAASVGVVVQYVGATDATYTNGYFYKCVSDGGNPATYSWSQVSVQPAPSGLPDQTGQSGKFLTTDGTDASWSDKPLVNQKDLSTTSSVAFGLVGTAQLDRIGSNCVAIGSGNFTSLSDDVIKIGTGSRVNGGSATYIGVSAGVSGVRTVYGGVCVGKSCYVGGLNGYSYGNIAIGSQAASFESYSVTLGHNAAALAEGAIQIGHYQNPNSPDARTENNDANTFKVANANGNFEIMSADGTVPHARLTNAVVSNSITIAVADWNGGTTCTKTVSGLTATSTVWVAPDNASQSDYLTAGVYASAQATDSITFTATTTPTSALTVNVVYC